MNGNSKDSPANRKRFRQSPRTLWTAVLGLVAVLLVITRLNGDITSLYPNVLIGAAVAFLLIRQLRRRSGQRGPKAAEPDPLSRLNLD